MQEPQANTNIYDPRIWKRFWDIAKPYWLSGEKWKAFTLFAILLLLPFPLQKSMAMFFELIGRSSTALQTKDLIAFKEVLFRIPVALGGMALSAVLLTYFMNRLSYEWELWLTKRFLGKYFSDIAFYHVAGNDAIDNPDQRICDSIGTFTSLAVGFVAICHNAVVALVMHTGVLWSISSSLCLLLLAYALIGSVVAALFGKRLIRLNFQLLQKGADLRYGLLQIRDNAESIAFYRGEQREKTHITGKLRDMIGVQRLLIGWERNLELFTIGHDRYSYFLPYIVLAPLFLAGRIPFGDIARASTTFGALYSALVVVVTYLKIFGQLATETARLETFDDAMTQCAAAPAGSSVIESQEGAGFSLKNVTVRTPDYNRILLRNAKAELAPGSGMLVAGASGTGKSSLLRVIAGLWNAGSGQIVHPPPEEILFLPQRPYMILGSLREQLMYPRLERDMPDAGLQEVLERVNLENLTSRVGGFDTLMAWENLLSSGEQQRLAFARLLLLRPRYAVLDEATSALDISNEAHLYRNLRESGTTYISVGHRPTLLDYHDKVLELLGNGNWRLMSTEEFRDAPASS